LLVHALLLYVILQHRVLDRGAPKQTQQESIVLLLDQPAASPAASVPRPNRLAQRRRMQPRAAPITARPITPPESVKVAESPPSSAMTPPDAAAPVDMMSMVNAARERRRATEEEAARENAEAQAESRGPSPQDIAMANIKRSLQAQSAARNGTNGVFKILSKGTRVAQFSFRGWTTDARNDWRQVIDVDAGLGGDVELAIVRKMIELIRKHYSGNFNWESRRLGHVVTLSARMADNAGLEEFLMREFFSSSS
jgi:hypothetical protein